MREVAWSMRPETAPAAATLRPGGMARHLRGRAATTAGSMRLGGTESTRETTRRARRGRIIGVATMCQRGVAESTARGTIRRGRVGSSHPRGLVGSSHPRGLVASSRPRGLVASLLPGAVGSMPRGRQAMHRAARTGRGRGRIGGRRATTRSVLGTSSRSDDDELLGE